MLPQTKIMSSLVDLLPSFLLRSKVQCDFQLQYDELHLSIRLRPHYKVEYKKYTEGFRFGKDSLHLLRSLKDHRVLLASKHIHFGASS